ncbi:uncharacterized protein N7459_005544 [Penicillium hispanicum]|uniref:uncharacterized protein n=1 Tax=Penicillium hispanicum TaxID=1080232 RepID=UPI002540F8DB|nr:uncharacterized protein N7459_005544 [Penicillium hispanicum]KAJ5579559.1 hypothetical protein N7459_005544 [Penicillium hispanicum]
MTPTSQSFEDAESSQDQLSHDRHLSFANHCTPSPSLFVNEDDFHSSPRASADANTNESPFEDAQAAEILSSIPRDPRLWQSQQGSATPEEAQQPSPVNSVDVPTPENEDTPTSCQWPSRVASKQALLSTSQVVGGPEAMLSSPESYPATLTQIPFEWGQSSLETTGSIQREEGPVIETANPLSS